MLPNRCPLGRRERPIAGHALAHPVAPPINRHDFGVVEQAIQERARQHVIAQQAAPLCEGQITGDQGWAALLARANQLKHGVGLVRAQARVAHVSPDSDAERHVTQHFPHKTVWRVGNGLRPPSMTSFHQDRVVTILTRILDTLLRHSQYFIRAERLQKRFTPR